MSLLRSKLFDMEQEKQRSEIQAQRKSQVLCSLHMPKTHRCGRSAKLLYCCLTAEVQCAAVEAIIPVWLAGLCNEYSNIGGCMRTYIMIGNEHQWLVHIGSIQCCVV